MINGDNITKELVESWRPEDAISKNNVDCVTIYSCINCDHCINCADCIDCKDLYSCTDCVGCEKSTRLSHCKNSIRCHQSSYLEDCQDCFRCYNLKGKKYCIMNVQLTPAEYKKIMASDQYFATRKVTKD